MPAGKIIKINVNTYFILYGDLCQYRFEQPHVCVYSYLHLRNHIYERENVRIGNDAPVDQFLVLLANSYIILSEVNMPVHISRNAQTNGAACVHTCTIFSTGEDTLLLFLVAEHRLTFQSSQFLWHLALRPVDANVPWFVAAPLLSQRNQGKLREIHILQKPSNLIQPHHQHTLGSHCCFACHKLEASEPNMPNWFCESAASVTKRKTPNFKTSAMPLDKTSTSDKQDFHQWHVTSIYECSWHL